MPQTRKKGGSPRQSKSEETLSQKSVKPAKEPDKNSKNAVEKTKEAAKVRRNTSEGTISTLKVDLTPVMIKKSVTGQSEEPEKMELKASRASKGSVNTPAQEKSAKGGKSPVTSTPPSTVRRSSRAPVPSSRFKDMEVETPGRKRVAAAVTSASEESDMEESPLKTTAKRPRKSSNVSLKSTEVSKETVRDDHQEKMSMPSKKIKATKSGALVQQSSELISKSARLPTLEDTAKQSKKVTNSEREIVSLVMEVSEEKTDESIAEDTEKAETEDGDAIDELKMPEVTPVEEEEDENANIPISVEEMIEQSLQEGKIDKSDLEAAAAASADVEKYEKQEQDQANDMMSETESVLPVQSKETTTDVTEVSSHDQTEPTPPPHPNITISGHEVTFTERGGETVAIVTIPPGLGVNMPDQPAGGSTSLAGQPLTEMVSMIPNSQGGHTIVSGKTDPIHASSVTSSLNLTPASQQYSSLVKPKNRGVNPLKGHGRVIPRSEQKSSPMFKGNIVKPTTPNPNVIMSPTKTSQVTKSGLTYSLLPPLLQGMQSPSSGPATAVKGKQKVIIVSQKASEDLATSSVSNLTNTLSISQTQVKPAGGGSTVVHVKKATGSALTASDLECVLKALSGSQASETIKVASVTQISEGVDAEKDMSSDSILESSTAAEVSQSQLDQEPGLELSQEMKETDGDTTYKIVPPVEQDVPASQVTQKDRDVDVEPKEGREEKASSGKPVILSEEVDHDTDETATGTDEDSPVKGQTDAPVEEAQVTEVAEEVDAALPSSSDTLPVESALYQALQALEPQQLGVVESEQSSQVGAQADDEDDDASGIGGGAQAEGESAENDEETWKTKGETIKVVDNGIEYDVRIVANEDVTEEIVGEGDVEQQSNGLDNTAIGVTFKEEPVDDGAMEKQTSGTQTLYSSSAEKGGTVQRMATVVDKDGQKKQVYYVSVFPGKGVLSRLKANQGARLSHASWVLSENGMYCCGKCNYKTDRKANFYKHRRLHIGSKPHICHVCQYKAGTSSNLKRHMGIHKDIREHKCDICGLCFRQKIHLERHVKYKHEEKSVQCPLCDYVCANEQPDLKMHMKRKHSTGRTGELLQCPECQLEVNSKKDLKQHMKFHKDGPELKLFCKECSFVTDCQSRLRRHAAIHSKLKPFQCGVCSYRAAQKEHVLRHLRTQHKIEVKREARKTWKSRKQTYPDDSKDKADFSSGDKIFACNHCTMRFAKLINLYKHLHTQHSDIMPPETSGNFFCVVCEFATTTKKNLLVHMRRHNMTDQTPPSHVYSCVLCRYVNPKRRNLFQHMRKKHNIDVSTLGEDETETQVLEMGEVMKSVKDARVAAVAAPGTNGDLTTSASPDLSNLASVIKVEELSQDHGRSGEGEAIASLVIDTTMDSAQVVHSSTATSLLQQQHAVDALEGLQALAEQAGLVDTAMEEQVQTDSDLEHPVTSLANAIASGGTMADGSIVEIISTDGAAEGVVTIDTSAADVGEHSLVVEEIDSQDTTAIISETDGEAVGMTGVELSEEQLSSLRHGDMVEMEGHLYIVELSQDPTQPDRQLLSFLPVETSTVVQDE